MFDNHNFRKAVKNGKEVHDAAYLSINYRERMTGDIGKIITKEKPYYQSVMTQKQETHRAFLTEQLNSATGNLLRTPDWHSGDLESRLQYFLRRKKQKLCSGNVRKNTNFFHKYKIKHSYTFFANMKVLLLCIQIILLAVVN